MTTPAPPGPSRLPPAPVTRPRARWLLLVGIALLLAGAGGAWWWFRPPPVTPPTPGAIEDPEVRRAVEQARQEVLDNPRSAAAWGRLGKVLLAHMFTGEADACFAEAARLDPADPNWTYARGWIAVRRDPDKPVSLLRQAVRMGHSRPEDQSAMAMQLAEALLQRGELDEAARLFREELGRAPHNLRAVFGLGLIAAARGDRPTAVRLLTAVRDSPHARKRAHIQLAALARAQGDREAAEGFAKRAAALPGDDPWPDPLHDEIAELRVGRQGRERLARSLERQGRSAEAAQVYLEQLAQKPDVWAYVGAGLNLARLRNFEQALPLLREAVRLGPDHAEAHFCLALALYERAVQQAAKAPGSARKGFQEAVGLTRRALELRPAHAQTYLVCGLSLKHLGEPGAAAEVLRQGTVWRPDDAQLQLSLGEVLLEMGQLKEAEVHLENARQLAPNDPRLARALERLRLKKG